MVRRGRGGRETGLSYPYRHNRYRDFHPRGIRRRSSRSNSRIDESRIFVARDRLVARTLGAIPGGADFLVAFTSKLRSIPFAL